MTRPQEHRPAALPGACRWRGSAAPTAAATPALPCPAFTTWRASRPPLLVFVVCHGPATQAPAVPAESGDRSERTRHPEIGSQARAGCRLWPFAPWETALWCLILGPVRREAGDTRDCGALIGAVRGLSSAVIHNMAHFLCLWCVPHPMLQQTDPQDSDRAPQAYGLADILPSRHCFSGTRALAPIICPTCTHARAFACARDASAFAYTQRHANVPISARQT